MAVKVIVLRSAGTNCDEETVYAFRFADAEVDLLHINLLRAQPSILRNYQILCLPGGFSYGDDISAGRVLALELELFLKEEIVGFIEKGGLVLGICNGFQVLVKSGLLPATEGLFKVEASLVENDNGIFVDKWVKLKIENRDTAWTHFVSVDEIDLPVAHAEGKFVADSMVLNRLKANNQIVFSYISGTNPNGSFMDIAGICDPTGRILGLMPHPERAIVASQFPFWPKRIGFNQMMPALDMFRSAVMWFKKD